MKPSDGGIRIEGGHTITIEDIPDEIRHGEKVLKGGKHGKHT